MSASIPVRRIRIKTFREMTRDGILAFWDDDPETALEKATSTYVYVDDDSDVPPDAVVFPDEKSPENLKSLAHILGKYALSRGWDHMTIGDEE
jgi:hypothetical protein